MTVDRYQADQWHDYFITVGGAAAALTGLMFVAMSLNLRVIANDPTHHYRTVGTLAGFGAIFVICGLALIGGQDHRAVGVEWLAVSAVAAVVYVYYAVLRRNMNDSLRPRNIVLATLTLIGGSRLSR